MERGHCQRAHVGCVITIIIIIIIIIITIIIMLWSCMYGNAF